MYSLEGGTTGIYLVAKQSLRSSGNFPLHTVIPTNSELLYLAPAMHHKVYPALPPSTYLSTSDFYTAWDSALSQVFIGYDANSPSRAFFPPQGAPKTCLLVVIELGFSWRVSVQVASCDTNDDERHSRSRLHKKYRGNCITWTISLFFSEQAHVPHLDTKNI